MQADLKTFAAHQVYGVNAITAIVAEAPGSVSRVEAVDPTLLTAQINRVESSFPIAAIKTGMLANSDNVRVVVEFMQSKSDTPLIIDPVIRASAGSELLSPEGLKLLQSDLIPLATLITPNLPEAELLLGCPILSRDDTREAPRRLFEQYGCDVLVKGGHDLSGKEIVDFAWISGNNIEFPHPRLNIPDVHGTGCTLSAAITAQLAKGTPLGSAVGRSIKYLTACLEQHLQWPESGNSESLNHFPNTLD